MNKGKEIEYECPTCGTEVKFGEELCPNCKAKLYFDTEYDTSKCAECGEKVGLAKKLFLGDQAGHVFCSGYCKDQFSRCLLCGSETSTSGTCKNCGFENHLSKRHGKIYEFIFEGNKIIRLPAYKNFSIRDYVQKDREKIRTLIAELRKEQEMASIGYFKGKMCPFTQVKIGGTTNIGFAVLTGAPTRNEYTWTHGKCIEEYCAIWDTKHKHCLIKTLANKQ
ncbi:MAG: hypothetical protein ABIB71_06950 [Candidatus Woesearchaeota archaeon]